MEGGSPAAGSIVVQDQDILVVGDQAENLVRYCADNVKQTHSTTHFGITRTTLIIPSTTHWITFHLVTLDDSLENDSSLVNQVAEPYEMCIVTFECNNKASTNKAAELVTRFVSAKSGGGLSMGEKVFPSSGSLLVGLGSDKSTGELIQDSTLGLSSIATQYPSMPILKVGTQHGGDRVEFFKFFENTCLWVFRFFSAMRPELAIADTVVSTISQALVAQGAGVN